MGKLIEFDPSKRTKKNGNREPKKDKIFDIGDGLKKFMKSRGENDPADLFMQLALRGIMVSEKIEEIKGNTEDFSQEVFSERKESVRSYTNDQLINFFVKSNSAEWHKDPAFYRAVANEVRERLKMIVKSTE